MRKISATTIYPITSAPVKDGVIIIEDGQVISIDKIADHDPSTIEFHKGVITPGFINTHCHLELSHMKAKVNTGTGLIPFISSVVQFRDIDQKLSLIHI